MFPVGSGAEAVASDVVTEIYLHLLQPVKQNCQCQVQVGLQGLGRQQLTLHDAEETAKPAKLAPKAT